MDYKVHNKLNEEFLERFPLEKLKDMTLEQYTNLNRSDSFCYWVETKTRSLGSVQGNDSYKFGIYRYNKPPKYKPNTLHDDKYAWNSKLGTTAAEAFENVKKVVISVAECGRKADLDAVEKIRDLFPMIKWKIAFLYSNEKIVPYYSIDRLRVIAEKMGMSISNDTTLADIQRFLIDNRTDEDIHVYGKKLNNIWKEYKAAGASTRDTAKEPSPIKYGMSYWIYSPGENASKWQECQEEGIMCIGWDELGDLSEYDSREEVRSEIKNYYPTDGNAKNDSLAVWQFANEMKPGDIVFAKKGLTKIIGRGVIKSDYVYDENRDDFKHIRKVEWTNVGEWVSTEQSAMKTLTNITKYKDYVDRLNELIVGNQTATNMSNNNYDGFIKLLKGNYNLILTGAPGTGKTYMARTIAERMGAKCKLVQFHPSYDYTDFVEGLRPIKEGETLGFQRKDGVFKEFCKEAIKNLEDSKKTKDELEEEKSFTDKYNELIDKIEEGEINELELRTGVKMKIVKVSDFNNIILRSLETDSDRTYTVSFDRLLKLAKAFPNAHSFSSISNISEQIRRAIGGCNASAYWAVLNELYKYEREDISYLANVPDRMTATYVTQSPNVVRRKPFVFIIDEINRGEISKIFGELFFSIDAGYRGEKGRVETQYQNLVPEEDVFSKGFYIPENVYIIGTMNDIDRSVESMDFAMRRRFAWKEITAKSRQSMLDDDEAWGANGKPSDSVIAEMKNRMDNLNAAIIDQYGEEEYSNKDKIGLSKAYQIGAAYFLKYALYNNFEELWTNHLEGLLYEYLRGKTNVEEKIERLHQAYNDTTKY
jgi:5-methylcytosine-specific restriction endonuclease McrBC GTP-binding regulatory subunit McrB